MHFQMIKVCKTDCVKIENLNEDASNDSIKLSFTNKSLFEGEVTRILRSDFDRTTAFVYFSNNQGKFVKMFTVCHLKTMHCFITTFVIGRKNIVKKRITIPFSVVFLGLQEEKNLPVFNFSAVDNAVFGFLCSQHTHAFFAFAVLVRFFLHLCFRQ